MKPFLLISLLTLSLTFTAQLRPRVAGHSITERLELSRQPLTARPAAQLADPALAARHLRRAGRCFIAGLGIGLASLAIGSYIRGGDLPRALPNTGYVISNIDGDVVQFVGALAGLSLTSAGGIHLVKAGNALER